MKLDSLVLIGKKLEEELELLPAYILIKFRGWIKFVELYGIREARKD